MYKCVHLNAGTAPHSISIRMTASALVKYVFLSDMVDTLPYLPNGQITVGDNSDVTMNTSCGVAVNGGGLYKCNGDVGLTG